MIILNFTKSFIRRTAPKQNMEDDSGFDTINKGDITHITWEWVQYVVDDIIGDNEEEGQYYNIIFTHPQFLTAASSKVRVNRVALSPSPTAVCSLE